MKYKKDAHYGSQLKKKGLPELRGGHNSDLINLISWYSFVDLRKSRRVKRESHILEIKKYIHKLLVNRTKGAKVQTWSHENIQNRISFGIKN